MNVNEQVGLVLMNAVKTVGLHAVLAMLEYTVRLMEPEGHATNGILYHLDKARRYARPK